MHTCACLRWAAQGTDLADGKCGALVEMRADLLEFVGACGFKTWSNCENPCFCCTCSKTELYEFPANVETSAWNQRDAKEYNAMVQRSLFTRVVRKGTFSRLVALLAFDERFGGIRHSSVFANWVLHCGKFRKQEHICTLAAWLGKGIPFPVSIVP
jgi:hypothetical protein